MSIIAAFTSSPPFLPCFFLSLCHSILLHFEPGFLPLPVNWSFTLIAHCIKLKLSPTGERYHATSYLCQLWSSLGVSGRVGHLEGKEKSRQLGSLSHSTLSNSTFSKKKKIPKLAFQDWKWKYEGDLIFLAFEEQRHEVDSVSIPGMVRNWSSSRARSIWILVSIRITIDRHLQLFRRLRLQLHRRRHLLRLQRSIVSFVSVCNSCHISYKQQVEGLQDINQLVGLLVPLLCDVPCVSKKMFRFCLCNQMVDIAD